MTTYEIDVPLWKGKPPLTLNQRLHWRAKAERTRVTRNAVAWSAKAAKIGYMLPHISVGLHYAPGDNRKRDCDNLVPTLKVAVDGLTTAKIVVDDDPVHVTTIMPTIHTGPGKRRLWITIHTTEEAA